MAVWAATADKVAGAAVGLGLGADHKLAIAVWTRTVVAWDTVGRGTVGAMVGVGWGDEGMGSVAAGVGEVGPTWVVEVGAWPTVIRTAGRGETLREVAEVS